MKHFLSDEVYISLPLLSGMEGRRELRVEVNCLSGLPLVASVKYLSSKAKKQRFFSLLFASVINCGITNNRLAKTGKHQYGRD